MREDTAELDKTRGFASSLHLFQPFCCRRCSLVAPGPSATAVARRRLRVYFKSVSNVVARCKSPLEAATSRFLPLHRRKLPVCSRDSHLNTVTASARQCHPCEGDRHCPCSVRHGLVGSRSSILVVHAITAHPASCSIWRFATMSLVLSSMPRW
ncbi:unnamed protein product [Citrullus colocynthis]|uniref:Uncharacterized protein n=1 Tax=Citrullus colocynthis TaxID=252529 RepID=A0ABP0Y5C1_9ROSI